MKPVRNLPQFNMLKYKQLLYSIKFRLKRTKVLFWLMAHMQISKGVKGNNKILFTVPPNISYDSFGNPLFSERIAVKKSGNYGSIVTDMPIGLLSLSAYLKKRQKSR